MIIPLWRWELVVQLRRGKHDQMIGYFTLALWKRGKAGFFYAIIQPSVTKDSRPKVTTAISETPAIVEYEVAKDED